MDEVSKTYKIDDFLNKIGNYKCSICGEEVSVVGVLRKEKNTVIFQAQITVERVRTLSESNELFQLWGTVSGTFVTLMSVKLHECYASYESNFADIEFIPGEIIIGRCYNNNDEPKVRSISASITALNYMFSEKPLDLIYGISKNNPYLLKYTYPLTIETDDKYGHFQLYQTFSQGWTKNEIQHSIIPVIKYDFCEPVGIMDALGRIASARNLFSFFANGYLPLENIEFADEQSDKIESQFLCDIGLFLNYQENLTSRDEPFLIRTSHFGENFTQIWQNWLEIYEGADPISTLFYEIIRNRSTGINCFLNLSQAIEVYSCKYRESEATELARLGENTRPDKKPPVHLKYRFEDVLSYFNDCLEIPGCEIPILAKNLADMRNYYTHYNGVKYTAPSYQEVFSATRILRFLLLTIVYKHLGLSTEVVVNVRERLEFQLYREDIHTILEYSSNQK